MIYGGKGRKKSVPASNDNIEQLQQQLKIRELEVQKARREIEVWPKHNTLLLDPHTYHLHLHLHLQEAKTDRWLPPGIPDTINRLLIGQVRAPPTYGPTSLSPV